MVSRATVCLLVVEFIKSAEPGGTDVVEPRPSLKFARDRLWELRFQNPEVSRLLQSIAPLQSVSANLSEVLPSGITIRTLAEIAVGSHVGEFRMAYSSKQNDCCGCIFFGPIGLRAPGGILRAGSTPCTKNNAAAWPGGRGSPRPAGQSAAPDRGGGQKLARAPRPAAPVRRARLPSPFRP
jgi:hypothetical protein